MKRFAYIAPRIVAAACLLSAGCATSSDEQQPITVGSKKFTENVILGEMLTLKFRADGLDARHRRELGGTRFLYNALLSGDIDLYADYTGTILQEILAERNLPDMTAATRVLDSLGIAVTAPLGFNNTYALGMREARARELDIDTITDLIDHSDLRIGFSNEFMDRGDGWPSLQRAYNLPHTNVRGVDHDLAYRGLEAGSIDVIDLYSTDAEIEYYGLRVLNDDRRHFPEYQAVVLYRKNIDLKAPGATVAINELAGTISAKEMTSMNRMVKIDGRSEAEVAGAFLRSGFGIVLDTEAGRPTRAERIWQRTVEHLVLVAISLSFAILVSIPLGIVAARRRRIGQVILGIVGVIYTIPSLALLVFMIPLIGIGGPPAIVALFLYSLLPIVRNTYTGLTDIPLPLNESAIALGLEPGARLRLVELPLASRAILAGIKTSAVINIGTATLGALIGAGGYGQPILTGIRLDDVGLILEGAVPAALLALAAQGIFEILERALVPRGLRLAPA